MGDFNFAIQSESDLDNVLNALENATFDEKVLPEGEYQVVIYDYKMDRNKKDSGDWLRLHFEVKGGPESGNNFVVFFNIVHENETAERIAKEELSRLCRACGLSGTVSNCEDLLHHELRVETKIEKDKVDGTERVAVKKYKPLKQAAASAPTTTNTDDFDDKLPWEKN